VEEEGGVGESESHLLKISKSPRSLSRGSQQLPGNTL